MATAPLTILKTLGGIVTTLGLNKLAADLDNAQNATEWLKKNANPILSFIGKKTPLGKKFGNYAKLITGSISIVDNALVILTDKTLTDATRAQKFGLISSSLESMAGATEELIKSKKLTSKSSNLWFMSIVSAGISLVANLVAGSDGVTPTEKEAINRSYILFMRTLGTDLAKKIFNAATDAQFNKLLTENVMEEAIANGKFFQNASKTFTKAFGIVMTFGTGILNGVDKYKLSMEKYTADGIPEKIAKHDAFIDALAKFIKETLSGIVVGLDDVIFNGSKWIFSLFGIKYAEDGRDYVEVLTDYLKTLNYKNSGTRNDDKFYVLENKSMVYGNDGNDDIGNYGFSNVTIWGGHDDDTIGSYKTDTDTPQNNSIFGGPGNDSIAIYDVNSTIYGGTGNDTIHVVGTNNKVFGDAGNDIFDIENGANNNTITGGKGNDFVVMQDNAENTLIKYSSGDGNDTIYGFNEDDSIKISGSYKTEASGNDFLITAGEGLIRLIGMAGKNININGKTRKRGEEDPTAEPFTPPIFPTFPVIVRSPIIRGTEGDDTINNTRESAMILALSGNDYIENCGDNVTIDGGADNDDIYNFHGSNVTIDGGSGDDSIYNGGWWYDSLYDAGKNITINGGDGNDTIRNYGDLVTINGGSGQDFIYNYGNNITVSGGTGNDSIHNNGGDNVTINTGAGNDSVYNIGSDCTINTGDGNDNISLNSSSKNNLILYTNGDGNDVIYRFKSDSTLSITGSKYSTTTNGYDVIVTVGKGKITLVGAASLSAVNIDFTKVLTVTNSTKSPVTVKSDVKIIDASTRTKAVKITGNKLDNTIIGGSSKDSLYGGKGNDSIVGNAGNDKLYGGSGNDTLVGGNGNDSLWGNSGADTFIYEAGDGKDYIYGFDNKDTLTLDIDDFKTSYSKKTGIITLTFDDGSIKLKDYTATTFHINNDTYQISGSKFVKK